MNVVTAGEEFLNDFLEIEGKGAIFRYQRLFFTILDAYRSARSHWTLKAPSYALFFPLIFEEYGDAGPGYAVLHGAGNLASGRPGRIFPLYGEAG